MKNDLTEEYLRQEVTVTLPLSALLRIAEPQPLQQDVELSTVSLGRSAIETPAIGAAYEGGVYAGVSIENEQPVALVLLPGEAEEVTWQQAKDWAAASGGGLPSRIDQLVLFKNLKAEFKEAVYWSGEEFAGGAEYAWFQFFSDGYQLSWHKGFRSRARAVRRVPI